MLGRLCKGGVCTCTEASFLTDEAALTVNMPRKTLEQLALDPSVTPANVTIEGDASVFEGFVGMLDLFDPSFNIILP